MFFEHNKLCKTLGYQFKNKSLLQQAITRKSAVLEGKQEKSVGHNERLEFFGDSLLRTVIDDILIELYPSWDEGQLSKKRDELVAKNGVLLQFAASINLHKFIIMGKGEVKNFQTDGKNKILSDVMEAVIAAIFIDSGKDYQTIKTFIIKHGNLQKLYDSALIEAILGDNVNQVEHLLKLGADPNATGDTTAFLYNLGASLADRKQWGEANVTLFYGGYERQPALKLALISHLVVPPIAMDPTKASPGRIAYIDDNDCISLEPLRLPMTNPTLQDIFAIIAPIRLILRNGEPSCIGQNLILEPDQPGYQILQNFFESGHSLNCLPILRLLLDYGADPNKKGWGSVTALDLATRDCNTEAIKLLSRYEADKAHASSRLI